MTKVLQIGPEDWSKQYKIPDEIKWEHNAFPLPRKTAHNYDAVLFTGRAHFTTELWHQLQWRVAPYCVLYTPGVDEILGPNGRSFLKCQAARLIDDSPEEIIKELRRSYYFGQTGIRLMPNSMIMNPRKFKDRVYPDESHLKINVDADSWQTVGTYKMTPFVDPGRQLKLWLECSQNDGVSTRLVVYSVDGAAENHYELPMTADNKERIVPLDISDNPQFIGVSVQVCGHGTVEIGTFHYRWARYGVGDYIAGGQRVINPENSEEIFYYLNPGNLKPPLNVYFSGAKSAEGFEAWPLFRYAKAPSLLFTDSRLLMGQFYTGRYLENKIMEIIKQSLKKLGFTKDDLVMTGLSMGSYPAVKFGSQLQAHAIIVGKMIANLGWVAERTRMERPEGFDVALDIASRNIPELTMKNLHHLDEEFWKIVGNTNLSKTRVMIGYMLDDDYDNHAIKRLKDTKAIKNSEQFITKGWGGHHNDNTAAVTGWFVERLYQIMRTDFGRKG